VHERVSHKELEHCKDALTRAERDIQSLTYRVNDKEAECLVLRFQLAEQSRMNEEDITARMPQHTKDLDFLHQTHRDVLS